MAGKDKTDHGNPGFASKNYDDRKAEQARRKGGETKNAGDKK